MYIYCKYIYIYLLHIYILHIYIYLVYIYSNILKFSCCFLYFNIFVGAWPYLNYKIKM